MLVQLLGNVKVAGSCMAEAANARLRYGEILPQLTLSSEGNAHLVLSRLGLGICCMMSLRLWTGFEIVILVSLV